MKFPKVTVLKEFVNKISLDIPKVIQIQKSPNNSRIKQIPSIYFVNFIKKGKETNNKSAMY